jgi:hypothetical protein
MKISELKQIIREEIQKLKEDKSTDLWNQYYKNVENDKKPRIFDINNVKDNVEKIKKEIKAPYVGAQYSDLGGAHNVGIYIVVSLDDKKDWYNNILENSKYFRMSLSNEGKLELFSGSHLLRPYKFRKTKVKSVDEAIKKINAYIQLASKGE